MKDPRIDFTYWIAAKMGKPIASYKHAQKIAAKFSLDELRRIYNMVNGRGTRAKTPDYKCMSKEAA